MDIKQVYEFTNQAVGEALGKTDLVAKDLSNIVDVGTEVFNANTLDKFVGALVDHIGKVAFVDRVYRPKAPSILMDSWEYGQALEKIDSALPEATENASWALEDGKSYDQNIFRQPKVSAKFYQKRVTFEIERSIATDQAKGAFSSASQMGRFIGALYTKTDNAITLKLDQLILATIGHELVATAKADNVIGTKPAATGVKAINLLSLYNTATGNSLTADKCLLDLGFLKFASMKIMEVSDHMTNYSTLFNVGGTEKFTPKDLQHVVLLSDFMRSADVYLQSDTYHNELVRLPQAETVSYWQGSGKSFALADVGQIKDGSDTLGTVLGTIFDRDAMAVACLDRKVTTNYNAKGDFTNYYYKFTAGYFNDLNENCVVFFVK